MYKNVVRLTSLLVLLFNINQISVLAQGMFNVKGKRDKALYGYSFLNITETSMERCLAKCLENCLCMSFQMCKQEECQLCSSDKEQSPSAFRERKECTYYAFQRDFSEVKNQQCQKSCSTRINCCITFNPCMNNGICEPTSATTNTRKRFKCKCPVYYTGDICQHPIKSCRGYVNGNRLPGRYKVLDDNMKPFEVFCDFDSNSTMAWTLIQSYKLQNKYQFQKPFFLDDPVNQDSPAWDSYRLSKSRMSSIQRDSSKWRVTCQYDTDGVVYRDYVRGINNKRDILAYIDADSCTEVEYIDIRQVNCEDCITRIIQRDDNDVMRPLHINSYKNNCSFDVPGIQCGNAHENNFGRYYCTNPAHRCSETPSSTTQTWFGGE